MKELDSRIIHINATPEFLSKPENVKAINNMVEQASKIRKCMNGRMEVPYMSKGKPVCTATHPDMPNYSGHARSRKSHLAKNETHTVCNMLIDQYYPSSTQNYCTFDRKCKICFK